MIHLILATALALQPADTTRRPIPPSPVARPVGVSVPQRFDAPLASVRVDVDPTGNRVLGYDKLQHFLMSYAVYSFSYAGDRALGFSRKAALIDAFGAVVAVGVGKEIYDSRHGRRFSVYDLIADALGGTAAYAVLKQVR